MIRTTPRDETVSSYYDEEMSESELLGYEARMALSNYVKNYTNEKCFGFYKISSSINNVNRRLSKIIRNESFIKCRKRREEKTVFKKIFDFFK